MRGTILLIGFFFFANTSQGQSKPSIASMSEPMIAELQKAAKEEIPLGGKTRILVQISYDNLGRVTKTSVMESSGSARLDNLANAIASTARMSTTGQSGTAQLPFLLDNLPTNPSVESILRGKDPAPQQPSMRSHSEAEMLRLRREIAHTGSKLKFQLRFQMSYDAFGNVGDVSLLTPTDVREVNTAAIRWAKTIKLVPTGAPGTGILPITVGW